MSNKFEHIYLSDEMLRLQYQDMLFVQAVREIRDDEVNLLRAEAAKAEEESYRYVASSSIGRMIVSQSIQRFAAVVLPEVIKTVAIAVAVVCISLTTAFAASESFRTKVYKLVTLHNDIYTEVELLEDASLDIPVEWEGSFYPTYIPDGFMLTDMWTQFDRVFYAEYRNEKGIRLSFDEHGDTASMNIDTENAEVFYADVNGRDAIVSAKEQHTIIVWNVDDRMLTVMMDGLDKELALNVARSVKRIN